MSCWSGLDGAWFLQKDRVLVDEIASRRSRRFEGKVALMGQVHEGDSKGSRKIIELLAFSGQIPVARIGQHKIQAQQSSFDGCLGMGSPVSIVRLDKQCVEGPVT